MLLRTVCLALLASLLFLDIGALAEHKPGHRSRDRPNPPRRTGTSTRTRTRTHHVIFTNKKATFATDDGRRHTYQNRSRRPQSQSSNSLEALASRFWDALYEKLKPTTTPRPTQAPLRAPHSGQSIRLRGHDDYYNVGRVEVYRVGNWGLVCDDNWDIRDAIVACKQLGFSRGAVRSQGKGNETSSINPEMNILMDEVNCQGSERALQQCSYRSHHDCLLSEAASVVCYPNQGCPRGWIAGNGKCYKFFGKVKNTRAAAKTCAHYNGSLLQIETEAENNFLSNILQTTRKISDTWWTAGRRTKGVWKWHKVLPASMNYKPPKTKSKKSKSTKTRKPSSPKRRTRSTKPDRTSKKEKNRKKTNPTRTKKKRQKGGKGKGKRKGKSKSKSRKIRTKTYRQKIFGDKWFPGWPSHRNAKAEPRWDKGLDCLALSNVFNDTTNKEKLTDYFFWKTAPCKTRKGMNFICQIEVKDTETTQNECYKDRGVDYRGFAQVTQSGSNCMKWNHSPLINERTHPGKGLGDHNFCRNPTNGTRPWCWVNHASLTFGYCLIEKCDSNQQSGTVATTTASPDFNCPDGEFFCSEEQVCIPESYRCDNEQDCTSGEDETECDYMLDNFKKVKNSALSLSNRRRKYSDETYLEVTDETCAKHCLKNTNIVCRSFIYDSVNRVCNLSQYDSSNGKVIKSPRFDFYEIIRKGNCSRRFQCGDGSCIDKRHRCDGIVQCNDFSDENDCVDDDAEVAITLVGGEEHSGTVQLTYKGVTGVVCDNEWSIEDANVVCRMLGYQAASSFYLRNHFAYPLMDVVFLLDNMNCFGNETSIEQCPRSSWRKHSCKAFAVAGVECQLTKACEDDQFKCSNGLCIEASAVCDGEKDCQSGSDEANCTVAVVELVNGTNPWEGRVEITRNGLTGTICDDHWDDLDARVVCKMMGYRHGGEAVTDGHFGAGEGPIWMDNVKCRGSERFVTFCPHQGWGRHDCVHREDAGVLCYRFPTTTSTTLKTTPTTTTSTTTTSTTTTSTTTRRTTTRKTIATTLTTTPRTTPNPAFSVHLAGGSKPNEGNVKVVIMGRKFSICDDNWDDRDAKVICRMLGYEEGGVATGQSKFGVGNEPLVLDEVFCSGTETSLIDCRAVVGVDKHDCSQAELAGVQCIEQVKSTKPTVTNATPGKPLNVTGICGKRPYDQKDLFARKKRSSDSSAEDLYAPRVLGKQNIQKIIRGRTADHGAYPWQARIIQVFSVFADGSYYGSHSCGGAIISEYWVLSAAHCFINKRKSQFRIGVGDHHKKNSDKGEQTLPIEEIFMHPKYQEQGKDYDIALLKIKPVNGKGIQFNDYVQPICLPDAQTPYTPGQDCIISGWGSSERGYPNSLKFANVPLISWKNCRQLYDTGRTGFFSRRMFCAGYMQGGVDTCDGDSGGPLACEIQDSYILVGLTSWGRGCGQPNSPGVYAKVDQFLSWIDKTIETNSATKKQKTLPQRLT